MNSGFFLTNKIKHQRSQQRLTALND